VRERQSKMVWIRSTKALRGLARYKIVHQHFGLDGKQQLYRYLVPERYVDRAIKLGGSIDDRAAAGE